MDLQHIGLGFPPPGRHENTHRPSILRDVSPILWLEPQVDVAKNTCPCFAQWLVFWETRAEQEQELE